MGDRRRPDARPIGEWMRRAASADPTPTRPMRFDGRRAAQGGHIDAGALITSKLKPGEALLWSGRGSGLRIGSYLLTGFFPLAIATMVIAFVVARVLDLPEPMPFVIDTIVLVVGYAAVRAILAPSFEAYGVTARRIIVVPGLFPRFARSFYPEAINVLAVTGRRKKGAVIFRTPTGTLNEEWRNANSDLRGVDNPRAVADLIRATLSPLSEIKDRTK